jgi:nicotinate-nucleotide adenylyltransferase
MADIAASAYPEAEILFLPAFKAAHKTHDSGTTPEHRLAMLRLALEDSPFGIEEREIREARVGYTIDTLRGLRQERGWTERPGFLLGDDLLEGFPHWKQAPELAAEAELLVVRRIGPSAGPSGSSSPFPFIDLGNPCLPISSQEIRRGLREGGAVKYLLPPGVYRYILSRDLYGVQAAPADFVASRLSPPRFAHCRRVAGVARRLAGHFGFPGLEGAAYHAGLYHDLARELTGPELLRAAETYGLAPGPAERENPVFLHGPVGAEILRRRYPGLSGDILDAVANHTLGKGRSALEKIIYIADYIEPGREYHSPALDQWQDYRDLEEFFDFIRRDSHDRYDEKPVRKPAKGEEKPNL